MLVPCRTAADLMPKQAGTGAMLPEQLVVWRPAKNGDTAYCTV